MLRKYARMSRFAKGVKLAMASRMSRFDIGMAHARFEELDTNGNGVISLEEFECAMPGLPQREVLKVFNGLDIGGEGFISYSEFIAGILQLHNGITEQRLRDAFSLMASEGEGYIEGYIKTTDLVRVLGDDFTEEEINIVQTNLDLNGDGVIGWTEFSQLLDSKEFFSLSSKIPASPPQSVTPTQAPLIEYASTIEALAGISKNVYDNLFTRGAPLNKARRALFSPGRLTEISSDLTTLTAMSEASEGISGISSGPLSVQSVRISSEELLPRGGHHDQEGGCACVVS